MCYIVHNFKIKILAALINQDNLIIKDDKMEIF